MRYPILILVVLFVAPLVSTAGAVTIADCPDTGDAFRSALLETNAEMPWTQVALFDGSGFADVQAVGERGRRNGFLAMSLYGRDGAAGTRISSPPEPGIFRATMNPPVTRFPATSDGGLAFGRPTWQEKFDVIDHSSNGMPNAPDVRGPRGVIVAPPVFNADAGAETAIPEPASAVLLALGVLGLAVRPYAVRA